jgi:hypothetical protein
MLRMDDVIITSSALVPTLMQYARTYSHPRVEPSHQVTVRRGTPSQIGRDADTGARSELPETMTSEIINIGIL